MVPSTTSLEGENFTLTDFPSWYVYNSCEDQDVGRVLGNGGIPCQYLAGKAGQITGFRHPDGELLLLLSVQSH